MRRPRACLVALRSSLWFVPSVIVVSSMLVAHGLVEVGARVPALSQKELPVFFSFGADGSRAMLSAIATSMITTAGVAFSITIVTLSLASTQYSPRVLRQFMRDRANQGVLGVFVGVFAYSLTVLPRVRGGEENAFVPSLAVTGGILYALVAVGCLIFFIHHIARSIQAAEIVSGIATETRASAGVLYPDEIGETDDLTPADRDPRPWVPVAARSSGYIQMVDPARLVALAERHDLELRLERGTGEFVVAGTPLIAVRGGGLEASGIAGPIREAVAIDCTRTIEHDVLFGIRQIVDIALRALSPSLNDATTATFCVHYLTTILHPLARRRLGGQVHRRDGRVRLTERGPDFSELLKAAFAEIRSNAGGQLLVLRAILRDLALLETAVQDPGRRAALLAEASAVRESLIRNRCEPESDPVCAEAERVVASLTR